MNQKLPDVKAGFRKGSGTRDQIANIHWIMKKGNLGKTSTSASLTAKAFDCVDYNKLWKFFREMGIPDQLTCLLRKSVCG